jgi:hypothetical protein
MDSRQELYQAEAKENSVLAGFEEAFSPRNGPKIPALSIPFAALGEPRKLRQSWARNPDVL